MELKDLIVDLSESIQSAKSRDYYIDILTKLDDAGMEDETLVIAVGTVKQKVNLTMSVAVGGVNVYSLVSALLNNLITQRNECYDTVEWYIDKYNRERKKTVPSESEKYLNELVHENPDLTIRLYSGICKYFTQRREEEEFKGISVGKIKMKDLLLIDIDDFGRTRGAGQKTVAELVKLQEYIKSKL